MKKLCSLFFSICLLACMTSCKTVYSCHSGNLGEKIPSLIPVVDNHSLENAFGISNSDISGYNTGGMTMNPLGYASYMGGMNYSKSTYRDASIQDVISYCEKEINDYICESGTSQGYAVVKVISGYKDVSHLLRLPSIMLGFCISNLFGMPWGIAKGGMQLQLEIYNNNKQRIAVYTSSYYKDKEVIAMYYGYSEDDAMRQCILDVVQKCMDDLKRQIGKDASKIKANLK